jgi:dimethylamine corrinoid protein
VPLAPVLFSPTDSRAARSAISLKEVTVTEALSQALVEMREDDVLAAVRDAQAAGTPPTEVIAALQAGMKTIGDKYESGEYYLSELIMAAEIFKGALEQLGLDKSAADTGARGTVVLGTVHTDIHDIGKNIVASVLSANGFKVVDLGVDVPAQAYLDAARESGAKVVGLSCLLTTAFPAMQATIAAFAAAGLRDEVSIIIGGGPVTPELAAQLGADAAGLSAQDAVTLAAAAVEGGAS